MGLSDGEKLIITMLADIQEKIGAGLSVDPIFIRDNIEANFWAIKMKYHGIFSGKEPDQSTIEWVISKLDMWRFIEESFAHLDDDAKKEVVNSEGAHGREPKLIGFDGHSEYPWIANTLIQDLEHWPEFAGRDMDSHMPDTEVHERMYEVFKPIRTDLAGRYLTKGELIRILNARIHPENRR